MSAIGAALRLGRRAAVPAGSFGAGYGYYHAQAQKDIDGTSVKQMLPVMLAENLDFYVLDPLVRGKMLSPAVPAQLTCV